MATTVHEAIMIAPKAILSILIWSPDFMPFLNFIENIGISLTRSKLRITAQTGVKYVVAAQEWRMLSGSLLT